MLTQSLAFAALIIPPFLIAVVLHELAHAAAATALGDDTPRLAGRLSLNPLRHIDPIGLLFLLIFRIGWAKPVPFDPRNFKRPRFYAVLTGLAGPFTNFLLAIIFMYALKYIPFHMFSQAVAMTFKQIVTLTVYVNVMLGTFNMLPVPPLDGSHIVYALLPPQFRYWFMVLGRYSIFIFIFIFYLPQTRYAFVNAIQFVQKFLSIFVI